MYTRSYLTEDKKIDIPENYDGNAFRENAHGFDDTQGAQDEICEKEEKETKEAAKETFLGGVLSPLLNNSPIKKMFSSLPFFKENTHSERGLSFGTEEVLISIVALYLFFSSNGDKECAIMLAILLFIH